MKIERGICSLCLENCERVKAIDGNAKNMLDILLLKIDFTVITEPLVCKNCEEMLIKCIDFKSTCLNTQNYIVPVLRNRENAKLDLKDVYLNKNVTAIGVPEDQVICGFCMRMVNNCSAISLDVGERDFMLDRMMGQCLPELDLSMINKPVICTSCHGSLEDYFHFVMNCLSVVEKTKKYRETLDINSKDQIELNSSLQLAVKDERREADSKWADTIKVLEQLYEEEKNPDEREIDNGITVKLEKSFLDDSEGANNVENKIKSFMETDDQKFKNEQQFSPKNMLVFPEDCNKLGTVKIEKIFYGENKTECEEGNFFEEDQNFVSNEEIKIKTDEHGLNRLEHDIVLPQSKVTRKLHRSEEHGPKITMFKCDSCSFQTKRKYNLKCHSLLHRNPSEVVMYKCDSCPFQSKHKNRLKRHLLVHKDPSEVIMYKCDYCSYQTRIKYNYKTHLVTHKDPSEITMYKCDSCSFQSKYKDSLRKHLLIHKDPLEVTMYKCDSCSYQAKFKYYFDRHLLTHKEPSEEKMFKCDSCPYKTIRKSTLQSHMLRHEQGF